MPPSIYDNFTIKLPDTTSTIVVALAGLVACTVTLAACGPSPAPADLESTLQVQKIGGTPVAFQAGLPVPTFTPQPRPRIELGGQWRFEPARLDTVLSLARRSAALPRILREAQGRERRDYDDARWSTATVPGASPPPDPATGSGWYRRDFDVPAAWLGLVATLKFGAVNYVADVWFNGTYLGYHEGGSTPFAFDASDALRPGIRNVLSVRVDNPPWGSRDDIVPWGLADWWNYGGILQPVALEATNPLYAVRADVVPHLDGAEVSLVLHNRSRDGALASLEVEIEQAAADPARLLDLDPRALASGRNIVRQRIDTGLLVPRATTVAHASFLLSGTQLWSPTLPALYLVHVAVFESGIPVDALYETFGLRRIAVDPAAPRLLLNGVPVSFHGVAIHDERSALGTGTRPRGGPPVEPADIRRTLEQAREVHADLIRTGHTPANPTLLALADRLGFAVWEEIPLYHYSPRTFAIAMARGIPQQMLREMVLRDMNHPAVLFHGLANESTGGRERQAALKTLRAIDRELDGTRLTGQAAYGSEPDDATSEPLDVAGYTFYYGVFYGEPRPGAGTDRALIAAHARYPRKPVMVLEFGRWADSQSDLPVQRQVFEQTFAALAGRSDLEPDGFVGASVWWALDDYWTMVPGLEVEHFGLFRPDGSARPVADAVREAFPGGAGHALPPRIEAGGSGHPLRPGPARRPFLTDLVYGLALSFLMLSVLLVVLQHRARSRSSP